MNNPILSDIANRLAPISDSSNLDASVLLAHVIGKPRTWLLAHPEYTLTSAQQKQLEDSLLRLEQGESFPYVLGHWEFFSLDFNITPDVLIPRPETELLVEKAIAWLNRHPTQRSVADVGTGSGAIAVSIAINIENATVLATDISPKALHIAKSNAAQHNVSHKINFIECDLLPHQETQPIDILCANLPYIPTYTLHNLKIFGHEPTLALDGGQNGFELIQKLMVMAPSYLSENAIMFFEFEATLGKQALELAHSYFPDAKIQIHQDLSHRDRLLEIQLI